jgi:hypothetical protein
MNTKMLLCFAGIAITLTACPTPRPLDSQNQQMVREFAPQAVASSTQFLRGAPVSAEAAIKIIQQGAQYNPRLQAMLSNAPTNLSTVFSRMQTQNTSTKILVSEKISTALSKYNLKLQAGTNCIPSSPVDNDGDGIPKSFNYTFDCSYSYEGQSGSISGTVILKDTDDNNENSGYEMQLINLTIIYTDSALGYGIGLRTNANTKVSLATNGKYTVSQSLKFEGIEYKNNALTTVEYSTSGNLEFTPIANASKLQRFAAGTLKFKNSFNFRVDSPSEKYSSSLEIISNAMQVDQSGCGSSNMVNSGNVQFTDGKNTLTWTITGCGTGTWDYQ